MLRSLPLGHSVLLAESLLDSLPTTGEDWSESEELGEGDRREREIETGYVQPISHLFKK